MPITSVTHYRAIPLESKQIHDVVCDLSRKYIDVEVEAEFKRGQYEGTRSLDTKRFRVVDRTILKHPSEETGMDMQQKVALFNEKNKMEMSPEYRLLDLASEMGEVAKDAAKSTEYGDAPEELDISSD